MHLPAVDLERYPIDRLESSEGRALLDGCAERFKGDGLCLLPGFIRPDAVAEMTAEANACLDSAYFCHNTHTAYLTPPDTALDPEHPRRRALRTDVGSIANDLLAPEGALQRLYDWAPLTRFIGGVLGLRELYCSADPIGALSVNVFAPGGAHAWHFDEALFTVTLMLQPAERGGHFEYVTGLRGPDHDDEAGVRAVLDGDGSAVQRMPFEPGTLSIFGGRHTLHRVTLVEGARERLVPVLTYDTQPGARNSDAVRELFWGRAEPLSRV